MNRKDAEMRERKPETGDRSAPPASASFPPPAFRFPLSEKASALITTLLVLVVLSTICVAFMQSMSIERSVAKSAKNKLQAELAAQAGVDTAALRIQQLMAAYPYHAIGYTNVGGQTVTILAGSTNFTSTVAPVTNYLLSVTSVTSAPSSLNSSNSTALNALTSNPSGWIGSPVTNGAIVSRGVRCEEIGRAHV